MNGNGGGTRPVGAALAYAARGWPVFPCHAPMAGPGGCTCRHDDCSSPAKHPRVAGGLKAATLNPDVIRGWWQRWPGANVGIRTGSVSGLVVVDVDPPHGGADTWDRLMAEHPGLRTDSVVRTGSGGLHVYLSHPGGTIRNDTGRRLGRGVDVRGDGGYVVAPPSRHVSGGHYRWSASVPAVADPPAWLVTMLRDPQVQRAPSPEPAQLPRRADRSAWAHAALEREAGRVRGAIEGTRNATLNRAAYSLGQIVGGNSLSRDDVESVLVSSALASGLSESEARATIESGVSAGEQRPRWPREVGQTRPVTRLPERRSGPDVDLPSPA